MAELHDELLALRADWPETPDLLERVLAAEPAPARRRRALRWKPALAALVAVVAGVMAVEPARSAVLEWLGLKSVKIERREPTATPSPALRLGPEISAEQARRLLPGLTAPPAALGPPDSFHALGGGIAFVYDGPLLVQRFEARVGQFIEKAVGGGARLERLRVGGDPAYWIEGAHGFAYRREGAVDFEDQRIAGNTLLVERRDGLLLRIEGVRSRDRAVAIARSVQ